MIIFDAADGFIYAADMRAQSMHHYHYALLSKSARTKTLPRA